MRREARIILSALPGRSMLDPKNGRQNRETWPAIVAHRGSSSSHPENTLPSYRAAIEAGADAVECDVRVTADGVAVIMHDEDVSRTTDGTGHVHELTLEELKRLDASGSAGPKAEIPTLREVLDLVNGRTGVNIEIKNMPGERSFDSPRESAATETVRLLHEVGFTSSLICSSFNWLAIERVRELDPSIPTGFLTIAGIDPWAALVYARTNGHSYVLPQAPALYEAGREFVQEAHREGVLVGTWVVDDAEALSRLFEMGVDAVATNDPETAVPVRDRFLTRSA
jgi:glycerophosphoryl diester phosphodiesterase